MLLLISHSVVSNSLWTHGLQHSRLPCPVLHHLLEFTQMHIHWVHDTIQPSCRLSSSSPTALNLSQHQGLFQWVDSLHLYIWGPKYWSLSFSISPFSEYSWLISFRIDWFDLLAVQGTLKSPAFCKFWGLIPCQSHCLQFFFQLFKISLHYFLYFRLTKFST